MRFRLFIIAIITLISCTEKINIATVAVDHSELYSFLSTAIKSDDYLKQISSSENTIITTLSGKEFTIDKCNIIEMDKLGVNPRDTWYAAPKLDEKQLKDGINIVDCGKFVYFYIDGQVFTLKSEIHESFNPPLPINKPFIKILFVGNSFNLDATQHLPGMLAADGTDRVFMGRVYHAGCTLPLYSGNYATKNYCSFRICRPGESEWEDNEEYDSSLKEAIEAEDWDIITFMEYTGNSVCWEWNKTEQWHINYLIKKCFEAHPEKRPTIVYMLTQTFALKHPNVRTDRKDVIEFFNGDQMAMYDTVTDFAQKVLEDTCIDDVIATGTAIQNLRTSSINSDKVQDLSRDGYHLDYGIGRYTAACAVFDSIFEPVLGLSLDNNSYRFDITNPQSSNHCIAVTDDNVGLCHKAARFATENPFTVTNMSNL